MLRNKEEELEVLFQDDNKPNLNNLKKDRDLIKKESSSGFFKPTLLFFWETIKVLIISFAIIIPIRYFVLQPFMVQGSSMEPSFHNGEYLLVNEIEYRFYEPARGDVIILRYPRDPSQYYIKRIIGLPNEKIQLVNEQIIIYNEEFPAGIELDEPYLPDNIDTPGKIDVTLGKDEYFVMGDNRSFSSDSRDWGNVKKDLIIGKTWIRCFPFKNFTIFSTPEYEWISN
ncbi:signal peptidase I [bacterium (Candidatus Torokbacteria) CG_4_10_14_0_2_um_filter_35_8]|nr:MAG: signal peptidase I [bacterium (Candidatus Torokbacteria) CG_4_10_14_0_2_um_filter_35_8]